MQILGDQDMGATLTLWASNSPLTLLSILPAMPGPVPGPPKLPNIGSGEDHLGELAGGGYSVLNPQSSTQTSFPTCPLCTEALILHRLLHRMKSAVKAQFPCYAYCVWNLKLAFQQSKLTYTFWACSVDPGPSWYQL